MSRAGTVVYSLTETVHLIVSAPEIEAALTHARLTASGMGFPRPVGCTSIITESESDTRSEVWSDVTHEGAVKWALSEQHERETGSVGAVVRATP